MDDTEVHRDIKHWPFKVKEKSGKPVVSVKYKGEDKEFVSLFSDLFNDTLNWTQP